LRHKQQLVQQQKVDPHGGVPAGSSKSTVLQSAFNLANILMGVGLLGLPFGFRVAGFGGAMVCLTVFGGICWRTSILIGRELNGDHRPSSYFEDNPFKSPHPPGSPHGRLLAPITSFPDIARRAFGESGNLILSCLLYFELFSCICIFFVSIGDHLHSLFPEVGIKTLTCLVAAISLVPSILLKTPTLLSYFSMVGTVATIVVVLTVVATAVTQGSVVEEMQEIHEAATGVPATLPPYTAFDSSGLVLCLGLVAYCFSGHAIVPSIYSSMKEPQRFEEMVTWTFLVVMATCFAVVRTNEHPFHCR
jgi:vesicular inhibitory amino acid transporter